jgi:hypothetical protein
MTLSDWASKTTYRFQSSQFSDALRQSVRELYAGGLRRFTPLVIGDGEMIYDHSWDALIVLDACRVDALEAVAPEYNWLPDTIPYRLSPGVRSREWLIANFSEKYYDEMADTVHVTWNAHSHYVLDSEEWQLLDEAWKDTPDFMVDPEFLTKRAIYQRRNHNSDRFIVHYQQPHAPYPKFKTERATADQRSDLENDSDDHENIWTLVRNGVLTQSELWDEYLDNLRYGLDHVETLLANLEAETTILTADHGELLGELGYYGHPRGVHHKHLRRVPWISVPTEDTRSITVGESILEGAPETELNVERRLDALGYR